MSFTNGQFGDDRYLIYQLEENDKIESMSFGQITNNTIDGLAPATFTQMDTTKTIMYKVTSRIPLEDFLQRPIKKEYLLKLLSGIIKSIRSAQEYMIDQSTILLEKKYIFLKLSNFEVQLVCLPVENPQFHNLGLQTFLWELVAKTTKDKSESREYVSELMEKLDADESLSLDDMEKMLESFSHREVRPDPVPPAPAPKPKPHIPVAQPETPSKAQVVSKHFGPGYDPLENNDPPADSLLGRLFKRPEKPVKPKKEEKEKHPKKNTNGGSKPSFAIPGNPESIAFEIPGVSPAEPVTGVQKPKPVSAALKNETPAIRYEQPRPSAANYGGTVVLEDDGDGTVLEESISAIAVERKRNPHLVRESNNEIIPIKGTLFQIGRDPDYSDYHISNNRTVGETHAQILMHENEYYIKDINSRNKTYVDDKAIPSMVETKLSHGCRVRLGSERFVFSLY